MEQTKLGSSVVQYVLKPSAARVGIAGAVHHRALGQAAGALHVVQAHAADLGRVRRQLREEVLRAWDPWYIQGDLLKNTGGFPKYTNNTRTSGKTEIIGYSGA